MDEDKSESEQAQDISNVELGINREAIVKEGQEYAKRKIKAVTDSLDRLGAPLPEFNGLLGDEDEKPSKKPKEATAAEVNRRGPRISEDV